jgi:SAM-dependent methyltransferase
MSSLRPSRFPKFLPPESTDRQKKLAEWKAAARLEVPGGLRPYAIVRAEHVAEDVDGRPPQTIKEVHLISFIDEVIPRMLEQKKPGEKVRILDVGGGIGVYAEELRKHFKDRVAVATTGISKAFARDVRKREKGTPYILGGIAEKLHPQDLKWRSVYELSDYPEFDLIIDSFGELEYSVNYYDYRDVEKVRDYLRIVCRKLKSGGEASLFPLYISNFERREYHEMRNDLCREEGVEIAFVDNEDLRRGKAKMYSFVIVKIKKR